MLRCIAYYFKHVQGECKLFVLMSVCFIVWLGNLKPSYSFANWPNKLDEYV